MSTQRVLYRFFGVVSTRFDYLRRLTAAMFSTLRMPDDRRSDGVSERHFERRRGGLFTFCGGFLAAGGEELSRAPEHRRFLRHEERSGRALPTCRWILPGLSIRNMLRRSEEVCT